MIDCQSSPSYLLKMTIIFVCNEAWPQPMLMSSEGKYEQEDCTNIGTLFVFGTKAYGLNEIEKGVFPHLFNTPENQ